MRRIKVVYITDIAVNFMPSKKQILNVTYKEVDAPKVGRDLGHKENIGPRFFAEVGSDGSTSRLKRFEDQANLSAASSIGELDNNYHRPKSLVKARMIVGPEKVQTGLFDKLTHLGRH